MALADAIRGIGGGDAGGALKHLVASVSVGVYGGAAVLDLDYAEDSRADTDMNVVMIEPDGFIEIQGTAEGAPFDAGALEEMLGYARAGANELFALQRAALES